MNFLNDVKNSFYNPAFYASLKERKLSSLFKYFFSLTSLLSVIIAFVFGVKMAPAFSAENLRKLADFYPKELTLNIKGGVISTNVAEPYIVRDIFGAPPEGPSFRNLVVIDTKNDFSVDAFKKYDTRVLIGKNFVVTAKNEGQFEFNDVSKMPDFSLSQERILRWIDLVGGHHLLISLAIFAALFLAFFGFFIIKLLALLLLALVILFLAKMKNLSLPYKNCYQIAVYAATVPFILETIFIISGIRAPIPFFFNLILLAIAFVNLKTAGAVSHHHSSK